MTVSTVDDFLWGGGLLSAFDKIKVSCTNLVNKSFSANKLEISFQTYSIDTNNHPVSKRDTNYSYHFSCSEPQTACKKRAMSSRCVQKNFLAKTWLRFFLGSLEVRALKQKYEMESVSHKM